MIKKAKIIGRKGQVRDGGWNRLCNGWNTMKYNGEWC